MKGGSKVMRREVREYILAKARFKAIEEERNRRLQKFQRLLEEGRIDEFVDKEMEIERELGYWEAYGRYKMAAEKLVDLGFERIRPFLRKEQAEQLKVLEKGSFGRKIKLFDLADIFARWVGI